MPGSAASAALEVIHPSGEPTRIPIEGLPFRIGRGPENDLIVSDSRVSRAHAWIVRQDAALVIEDLESLHGTWVNGSRIEKPTHLRPGDAIHFGFQDSYHLVFRDSEKRINRILDQISSASSGPTGAASSFARLRALVEVARTLQSSLAVDEVLGAVVDAALALTGAERGFLLLRAGDELETKVARDAHGSALSHSDLHVPTSVMHRALTQRHDLLSMKTETEAWRENEAAQAELEFPNVICVPLVQFRTIGAQETISSPLPENTVGLLYLDSRRQGMPVSELNRELLHTLALEASTVLESAKLLEEERRKSLLRQELEFARQIQVTLLPQKFPDSGWLRAAGSSVPSAEVAGDYFDVHAIGNDMWIATIADVSGKGISSALLASLLQGAFLLGSELDAALDAVMEKMNRFLIERAQREKYATLFYARIHSSGKTEWVNAGHWPPLLARADGEVRKLQSTGSALGLLTDAEFEIEHLELGPGDKILAYSDGLAEAENSDKEMFESRMNVLLEGVAKLNAQQTHEKLMQEVVAFCGDEPLRDDITLLVLEYRGQAG